MSDVLRETKPLAAVDTNDNEAHSRLLDGLHNQGPDNNGSSKGKVLVVLSSENHIDLKDGAPRETGYFLNELGVPLQKLVKEGYEPVFADPQGNKPSVDTASEQDKYFGGSQQQLQAIKDFVQSQKGLEHPVPLKELADNIGHGDLDQFKAIFIPGGHAPMQDLWKDPDLGKILKYFHENHKPTAMLCHGPISSLSAMGDPNQLVQGVENQATPPSQPWIYKGYNMTVFSDAEENGLPLKFYPEDALKAAGANVQEAPPNTGNVIKDRELITGQNPYSDQQLAKTLLDSMDSQHK